MKYKKAILTVGAIGVLGSAGSFGTFAAFTDALDPDTSTIDTGNIEVSGTFAIPDVSNLITGDPAQAGSVTISNTGDRAEQIWMDQDGPVGTITGDFSDHVLAENLIVDSTLTFPNPAAGPPTVTIPLDQDTRLWKVNRRGLSPLPGPGSTLADIDPLVLQPGQSATVDFNVNLRERGPSGDDEEPGGVDTSLLDNAMQNQAITQTLHVRSIEDKGEQADDFGDPNTVPADGGSGTPAGNP